MRQGWARQHSTGPRRGRRTAITALLALAALTALVPSAHGAANMEVAVQDDPLFVGNGYYGRVKGLRQARQLGATRIRVNLSWTSTMTARQARARRKPSNLKYTFQVYDPLVAATAGSNIRVQFALVGPAPAWATGNKRIGPNRVNAKHFGDFASAVANQYGHLVDRFSIWNEPNYVGWLAPLSSAPRNYRSMYVEGYNAIKAAAPNAQVLIAETSPYGIPRRATAPIAFIRKMTCSNRGLTRSRCGGLKADGFAHHPYDFDHAPTYKFPGADNATINTLGRLTTALDRLARSGGLTTPSGGALDLYLTEYGYFRSGKRRVPESRRAKWLAQGFQIAQRNPRVREMLQYLLAQPARKYRFFDTSIVSNRGRVSASFKSLQRWAKSALARGAIAGSPVVFGGGGGGGTPPYEDPNSGGAAPAPGGGSTPAPTTPAPPGTGGTPPPTGGGTPCAVPGVPGVPPGCTP